jgi:hypothetical protein
MKATYTTAKKARNLSLFIYNRETSICNWRIAEGEDDAQAWIKAIEKKYNVIA